MKLLELGGDPPTATLVGEPEEIRALARYLLQEVAVVPVALADVDPTAMLPRINALRIERGMSWRSLAAEVGVAPSMFSRWLLKRGLPSARTLLACSRWLEANSPREVVDGR